MPIVYLTIEQAIETHQNILRVSNDMLTGVIDAGPLEGVIQNIRNDNYYPAFEDKITHLFFCAAKFHCFVSGNKRLAITLCAQMFLLNGYYYCVADFMRRMENTVYDVACDRISKDLLKEIIVSFINRDPDNEELLLKIYQALTEAEAK